MAKTALEIFSHLPGSWSLDRDLGNGGTFSGKAVFAKSDGKMPVGQNSAAQTVSNTQKQSPYPDQTCLHYHEEGIMTLQDGQTFEGFRDYLFILHESRNAIEIVFCDPFRTGQRYVFLEFPDVQFPDMSISGADTQSAFSQACDTHPCGQDLYQHQMIWKSPTHFETNIKIDGPKKDHSLQTIYRSLTNC